MTEIIGNAPDWQTFAKAAAATGQTDDKGRPIAGGPLAAGGAWFYNAVGTVSIPTGKIVKDRFGNDVPEMTDTPGKWARIRFNGDTPTLPDMIAVWRKNGVTIYELIQQEGKAPFWSSDGGTTPAPDWVANIGVIA